MQWVRARFPDRVPLLGTWQVSFVQFAAHGQNGHLARPSGPGRLAIPPLLARPSLVPAFLLTPKSPRLCNTISAPCLVWITSDNSAPAARTYRCKVESSRSERLSNCATATWPTPSSRAISVWVLHMAL